MKRKTPKVLLISMPWTSLTEPSLGLSILKSKLKSEGIKCTIKHFNIFLLKYLKVSTYHTIANIFAVNEFLFTYVFENGISKNQNESLKLISEQILSNNHFYNNEEYNTPEKVYNLLLYLRNSIIPAFLEDCLSYVKKYKPTMIGFTCMYDQTVASLALANSVHKWDPNILLAFGGYSIYGSIGKQLIKSFDFIDCIVSGPGECCVVELAKVSIGKRTFHNIPNISYRDRNDKSIHLTDSFENGDINDTPLPDFSDFINDTAELSTNHMVDVTWNAVPIITSSGCWWGEKSHCVFCGINESYIKYRYKREEVVFAEILELYRHYNKRIFRIYDYILCHKYYETLLPRLSEYNKKSSTPFFFTCEIKSNVTEKQIKRLKEAGFLMVQPGIESFSTNVLKKMHKGVRAIQNIQCLVLGFKYNIYIGYNILFGFPNDEIGDYQDLAKTIPMLYHLHAPNSCDRIAITKDSPLHIHGEHFGINQYYHHKFYDCMFSKDFLQNHCFDLDEYCYYYHYPFTTPDSLKFQYLVLQKQVSYWKKTQNSRRAQLFYKITRDSIVFFDSRYTTQLEQYIFDKCVADVYQKCDCTIAHIDNIYSELSNYYSRNQIHNAVEMLREQRLVFVENNEIIGLAFPEKVYDNIENENKLFKEIFLKNDHS